jgi:predicted negative regulator of RcsB-dependent stress response
LKSSALSDISTELAKQGKVEEALICARGISDDYWKSSVLESISTELAKQGKVEEAHNCARGISDYRVKSRALKAISIELTKQGKLEESALAVQEALTCAWSISNDRDKNSTLNFISTLLAKQGKIEEALNCARGISDDYWKSRALKDISTELAKQGDCMLAETIALEIPLSNERHLCWQNIANNFINENSWQRSLEMVNQFQNFEAKNYYLKGFSNSIHARECSENLFYTVSRFYLNNLDLLKTLLQKHALHQLFFQDASAVKLERLNRTLNIQWAIDIKNQIPN